VIARLWLCLRGYPNLFSKVKAFINLVQRSWFVPVCSKLSFPDD